MFIHFTDKESAEAIVASMELWESSIVEGIYAVSEFGVYTSSVQQTKLGRATDRNWAVVFEADRQPEDWMPEEVIWSGESLTLTNAIIVPAEEAAGMLLDANHPQVESFCDDHFETGATEEKAYLLLYAKYFLRTRPLYKVA